MSQTRQKIVRRPDRAEGGLTEAELASAKVISDEWIRIAYRTDPIDPKIITAAIHALYAAAKLAPPRVVICASPRAMRAAFGAHTKTDGASWATHYHGGNMWAGFPAYACAMRDALGLRLPVFEPGGPWQAWEDCARHGGFRIVLADVCFVSDFPLRIRVDERHRAHCADGPSHLWRDGWALYHWHGVRVSADVIERPESITAAQVSDEQNAEVRRVLVERMGVDRYIRESGAGVVHRDDFGVLYRSLDDGQLFVEVVNSTVEPDGTSKRYYLSVHPEARPMRQGADKSIALGEPQSLTARNAVASTFGLRGEEYHLAFQS